MHYYAACENDTDNVRRSSGIRYSNDIDPDRIKEFPRKDIPGKEVLCGRLREAPHTKYSSNGKKKDRDKSLEQYDKDNR